MFSRICHFSKTGLIKKQPGLCFHVDGQDLIQKYILPQKCYFLSLGCIICFTLVLFFFSHLHYNTVSFNGYNVITAICKRKQIECLSVVCWQMLWFHKSEVRRYGLLCRLLGNKFLINTYLQWSQNNNKAGVKKSKKFKSVQMKGSFSWN